MRLLTVILCLIFCPVIIAADRHYTLTIAQAQVNISGSSAIAMLINGTLPGPVLRFNEGDTAHITVHNQLSTDASIHWHGLLLPQDQDGVPYVTFMPIPAGGSFTYQFPLSHAGTYWYHSHTNIDEQRGQYGAIVVLPRTPDDSSYDYDEVVQLSDWTDEDPAQVLKNLKQDAEWYAAKKGSVVSVAGYAQRKALPTWLRNRWQRMEGMDVSDVGYDAFLANGQTALHLLPNARPGQTVRLRLINSAASSYFHIQQVNTPFTVIAADGLDVQPVTVQALAMGMAETYDVLLTIPPSGGAVLAANNIDGSGAVVITIGKTLDLGPPRLAPPDLYQAMNHTNHAAHAGTAHHHDEMTHSAHQHHGAIPAMLRYEHLKTRQPVRYGATARTISLDVTGDMESYTWSFNGKTMTMADAIKVSRGEVVRFVFNNTTMMHHPLHLHGHFFKVISGNGDHDVLKHTVDVPPMAKVTIEFLANAEKDWLFHCHNLYHAKAGMARIVRYDDYHGSPQFMAAKKASTDIKDDDYYHQFDVGLFTGGATLAAQFSNIHYSFSLDSEYAEYVTTETTLTAAKKFGVARQAYIGLELDDGGAHKQWRIGGKMRLPFLVDADVWLDDDGKLELMLASEFRLSRAIVAELEADTRQQWHASVAWQRSASLSWRVAASDAMPLGIGVAYRW